MKSQSYEYIRTPQMTQKERMIEVVRGSCGAMMTYLQGIWFLNFITAFVGRISLNFPSDRDYAGLPDKAKTTFNYPLHPRNQWLIDV